MTMLYKIPQNSHIILHFSFQSVLAFAQLHVDKCLSCHTKIARIPHGILSSDWVHNPLGLINHTWPKVWDLFLYCFQM